MTVDLTEFEELDQVDELRDALNRTQRALKQAKAKSEDLVQAVYQGARDAAVSVPPIKPRPVKDRRKSPEAALLFVSDWHVGKKTSTFDSNIAVERVQRLAAITGKIIEIERSDHPVNELHALLSGDLVDNLNIFPGHAYEVDASTFEQIFTCAGALTHLLSEMLGTVPTVHVWEQTGNHGRIGKKGDHPRKDNVDTITYRIARERLADYEKAGRLIWHERQSWYTIVEIGSYRALQIHGDQIKSFGGSTPAFGIARKANAWCSGVLPSFVDVFMGHFHQPLVVPLANGRGRVFVGPSIESDSGYAKEFVAATGSPSQRLVFVNADKGQITSERLLWLDA